MAGPDERLPVVSQYIDAVNRVPERYDEILKTLLSASETPPGERIVTAAQRFTENRRALQQGSHVKTAAPVPPPSSAAKALEMLVGPKGLMIGGSLIGLGALGAPTLTAMGERIRKGIYPTLGERMGLPGSTDDPFVKSIQESVGKQLGIEGVGLMKDVAHAGSQIPDMVHKKLKGQGVFKQLQKEDDVLAQADPKMVMDAYQTMTRFAPTLATDPNAVRTFLRESALYGSGPNVLSVKQIADTEKSLAEAQPAWAPRRKK